jgi:ATP-dependent Clp protease ATP-binding subunit ClpA
MFERYTEKARRSIFFARWEAGRFGSPMIEPEHLVLGLTRCTNIVHEGLRADIEQLAIKSTPASTSVDLPVSNTLKRAMILAGQEAEQLGHQHVGVEHLLLGLMVDEHDSPVPGLLRKHGIDRALVLSRIPDAPVEDADERESLRTMVDHLPPRFLRNARTALEHLQGLAAAQPGINDLWLDRPRLSPEAMEAVAKPRTRRSTRVEDGVEIVETSHFRDGIEITLIERFHLSVDGKTLSYTQEVTGPGNSEHHTIDFNVM